MPTPNMYRLVIDVGSADKPFLCAFMIYGVSKPNAKTLFCEARIVKCEMATSLEIMNHVRAQLPVIGEPSAPDPNQPDLSGIESL